MRAGIRALKNSIFEILRNREEELSPRMVQLITGLYEDWLWLDERIEQVTGEIEKIAASEPNCRLLMSVPGVGPIISTAMAAAIGDGEAFERGRDFGAWLGLVPRQYSTGGRSILGRISKRGDRYLRTMFIQAAKVLLMRPQSWERFSFGAWLKQAAPRNAPQQARHRAGQQAGADQLERAEASAALRHQTRGAACDLSRQPLDEFATEQQLERSDRRTLNLMAHLVDFRPGR